MNQTARETDELRVTSEIVDGMEELWVTSDSTVIHLSIDVAAGRAHGFSCRLAPRLVVEMGKAKSSDSGFWYPMLCFFTEDDECGASLPLYCRKYGNEWSLDY